MNTPVSIIPVVEVTRTKDSSIPRRFIQTWKDRDLSLSARAAVANIKLLNPDFDYCFFDNQQVDAFVAREFPEYREVFESFPLRIQRYDFFRYLAVYRLGGFYLDLDVFLARSLAPLLGRACVFPFEELTLSTLLRHEFGIDWEIGNYAFGAAPGHPFMKRVIDNCVRAQRDQSWASEMIKTIPAPFRGQFIATNTTGPGLITRTLAESAELRNSVTVLFPDDVCNETGWHNFGDYGVHLMEGTWRDSDGFIRSRLARIWETRQRSRLLQESRRLAGVEPVNGIQNFQSTIKENLIAHD